MVSVRAAAPPVPIDPDPQHPLARGLRAAERAIDRVCGAHANPLRQLGALAMWSFWLSAASGAYLYIWFETSADGAWSSVQALQEHPVDGIVKSLHRYSSFALLALSLLHLAAEWLKGRYRGFRWFSWVSGVPLLWLAVACGLVGYWLVADTRAQYVATGIGEWTGVLPGVGDPMMRNFVTAEAVSDRLLSLLVFLHIGVGLFLLLGIWAHLARLVRPQTWPAQRVFWSYSVALLAACVLLPALATARADFARVPDPVPVDWLTYGMLPLMHATSPALAWLAVLVPTLLLVVLPWIGAPRRAVVQPAVVDPANCNGCRRCFDDCPYGAVTMVAHPNKRHREMARVVADQCAACGICVGACPSSTPFRSVAELTTGIDLPQRPLDRVRHELQRQLAQARAAGRRPVVAFGCDHGASVETAAAHFAGGDVIALSLPCSAALPPAFAEYAQREGARAVLVADCGEHACVYRFGAAFTRARFDGTREPHLRQAARPAIRWLAAGPADVPALRAGLARLLSAATENAHG
jgi:ferredoxin